MTSCCTISLGPYPPSDFIRDGLPKRAELFYFFEIAKPADFRHALFQVVEQNLITSVLTQLRQRIRIQQVAALDPNPKILIPMSMVNIAFSAKGLEAVSLVFGKSIGRNVFPESECSY